MAPVNLRAVSPFVLGSGSREASFCSLEVDLVDVEELLVPES
jgi:hypothetical protein